MSDQERKTLSEELREFRAEVAIANIENATANATILERLDGKVGPTGAYEGGLCETVKSHDRFVRRFQKWEWTIIVAVIGAVVWMIINGHGK